ncbi:YfhO family protein [Secundilactobacillus kimchicus]|uniref:YfhO family protein n=1 Tax=Secundilactobacillus kimchicus TaxID=528209 RepID=UPI000AA6244E|nr:YfhO family protein [Secundilactobacillus kimchicus]
MRFHFHLSTQQRQQLILGLSFVVPTLVMTMYFISRHMAPFGSSSLLTVDLGQQYVDFFCLFPP